MDTYAYAIYHYLTYYLLHLLRPLSTKVISKSNIRFIFKASRLNKLILFLCWTNKEMWLFCNIRNALVTNSNLRSHTVIGPIENCEYFALIET